MRERNNVLGGKLAKREYPALESRSENDCSPVAKSLMQYGWSMALSGILTVFNDINIFDGPLTGIYVPLRRSARREFGQPVDGLVRSDSAWPRDLAKTLDNVDEDKVAVTGVPCQCSNQS